ncbi:MAG: hypothetical protein BWK80_37975 [Desulfobacteraceae bacterium IS3]|nr:MAG: hypothetical protein BWK80_37975 [Desulfobacteraceae bacterium IS3]
MNLYFLLEGKGTEPKVYPKWIEYTFPTLRRTQRIEDMIQDSFFLLSAKGYPRILKLIEQILSDISQYYLANNICIEHFFICLDADEDGYEARFREVQKKLSETVESLNNKSRLIPSILNIHIIIQNCCIETWFLGNTRMLRRNPQNVKLVKFKKFYDVSINDPELMNCYKNEESSYITTSQFHKAYLKEMLREKTKTYSETHPGITSDREYFSALKERIKTTGHLQSLKILLDIWNEIKS